MTGKGSVGCGHIRWETLELDSSNVEMGGWKSKGRGHGAWGEVEEDFLIFECLKDSAK